MGPAAPYGTMTTGTGECRARLTATDPTTRWATWDELPTMMTTVASRSASRKAAAAAMSSSATMPWPRWNSQAAPLAPQLVGGLGAKLLLDLVEVVF